MDRRIGNIPRFKNLKKFKNGLGEISKFTADDYRNLMKIMIFAIDDILKDKSDKINKLLIDLYLKWNIMYAMSRRQFFSEKDLVDFQETIKNWAEIFIMLFQSFSPSGLALPKLHSWVHHTCNSIKVYGSLNGQTAETYETLHKFAVKIPYRSTNKRNPTNQMLDHVYRQDITSLISNLYKKTHKRNFKNSGYSKLIKPKAKLLLANINGYINNQNSKSKETIDGLKNLISCLDTFLDMDPKADKNTLNKHTEIQLFETAKLCSDEYIRCTENFYSEPMFSNVMIYMDEEELEDYPSDNGNCYGKVV
jgi:hypothetical protein